MPDLPIAVLCIPGTWVDMTDFIQSVVSANSAMGKQDAPILAAGRIILDTASGHSAEFIFEGADESIGTAFANATQHYILTEQEQRDIDAHKSVVYLLSRPNSVETSLEFAAFGDFLLAAGGLGVKVETAGKAFPAASWRSILQSDQMNPKEKALALFVFTMIADEGGFWCCGMHQLGFPDAFIVTADQNEAMRTLTVFQRYQLYENPTLVDGHTFSVDESSPRWKLSMKDHPYYPDAHIDRSLGMWHLSPPHF